MAKRFLISKLHVRTGALFFGVIFILSGIIFFQSQSLPAFASDQLDGPDAAFAAAKAPVIITVNTSEDHTQSDIDSNKQNLLKYTCTYTQGTLFFPAPDGKCTLRRAIVESSARPQSDRTDGIFINFNLPANDPNADLEVAGTWTIFLDSVLPPMETDSIINLNGSVTLDGSTQPGGRTDGPPIIIDSADTSLEIESEKNVIKSISWKNGGAIFIKNKADGNIIQNIWMGLSDDGQEIHFRDENDRKRMAMGGLVISSDDNVIGLNVLSGAFAKAISISGGDDNLITLNLIGTRADGTIPEVNEASECNGSLSYDPALWYGGWGISLGGSRNIVSSNIILSMHILRSPNDTSPVAIEIFGSDHKIMNNRIGVDVNGADEGVCGHAIQINGSGHEIAENEIAKSRISFEDGEEAAMFSRDGSPLFGQNEIYGNIVRDGPGKILIFSGNINSSLKFFKPAKVTKIDGTEISGEAEEGFPCPNCTINFYLDDIDETEEALAWLGSTDADSDGKFSFTMSQPLQSGEGIRTMATTNGSSVIGSFGPGTTSEASRLFTPITDITFSGPITGFTDVQYQIDIQVWPEPVTLPITYSIKITDEPNEVVAQLDNRLANVKYTWTTPGTKTIEVTADNGLSKMTKSTQIEIEQADIIGDMTGIVITGPTTGDPGVEYTFDITVNPADVQTPIDYTLEVTDVSDPFGGEFGRIVEYKKAWSTGGIKTIKVTADNGINSLSETFEIEIVEPDPTPIPSVTPEPSTTPGSTPSTPMPTATPGPTGTPDPSSSSDKLIFLPLVVR